MGGWEVVKLGSWEKVRKLGSWEGWRGLEVKRLGGVVALRGWEVGRLENWKIGRLGN